MILSYCDYNHRVLSATDGSGESVWEKMPPLSMHPPLRDSKLS